MRKVSRALALVVMSIVAACSSSEDRERTVQGTVFEIRLAEDLSAEPIDGRLLLLLSTTPEFNYEGIDDGAQVFGMDVYDLGPGGSVTVPSDVRGAPTATMAEIPPGNYYVQVIVNRYTTFQRSDGHTVQLHHDQGEGQLWYKSPGNLRSTPKNINFDFASGGRFIVNVDEVIPPIEIPADNEWVKGFRMVSELASEFWGQPMEISARVLLPKGWADNPEARYPLIIWHGHHYTGNPNPGDFIVPGETPPEPGDGPHPWNADKFSAQWMSDDFPRFVLVTIQHPTPYFDASYAINSANMGPYGDALTREFVPALEKEFRAVGEPWARLLTGGSTGGWEAIAAQVWYPDDYGGTWAFFPDQVDFHYYQLVNLYEDDNAYERVTDFARVPIPSARFVDGRVQFTMAQENHREEVIGPRYRSGQQWAVWNALFAPVAEDGYPQPLWDPWTGKINREAADWAIENYDLVRKLREEWPTLGPKLEGKLNVFTGRRDNFYLEQAVYRLQAFLEQTEGPQVPGRFEYGTFGEHGWSPWKDRDDPGGSFREMAEHLRRNAPAGYQFPD